MTKLNLIQTCYFCEIQRSSWYFHDCEGIPPNHKNHDIYTLNFPLTGSYRTVTIPLCFLIDVAPVFGLRRTFMLLSFSGSYPAQREHLVKLTLTYTRGIKRVNSASKTRPTKRLSFAFCGNYTISALASMRCGCRPWSKPRQRVDGPEASGHMVKEAVNKSCHFRAYAWKMHVFLVQPFHTRTSQFPFPRGGGGGGGGTRLVWEPTPTKLLNKSAKREEVSAIYLGFDLVH